MKPSPDTADSLRLRILCYFLIAASTPFILFPSVRLFPWSKLVVGIMFFCIAIIEFRRGIKDGTYGSTIGQIYAQAKAGRRFASRGPELAAFIAVTIAFWKTI